MLANIVDCRSNCYDVRCDVAFEPSHHDNYCKNATQFPPGYDYFDYDELRNTTVAEAVAYANKTWEYPVTAYFYDLDVLAVEALK